jgi:hypothetical protein
MVDRNAFFNVMIVTTSILSLLVTGALAQSSSTAVTSTSPPPAITGVTQCMLQCFNVAAAVVGCQS